MRASSLLRRGWRATIFLAVLAGLASGIAMAAWGAGRRTATAFDRFVAHSDPPELIVTFCPAELTEINEDALDDCLTYPAVEELARACSSSRGYRAPAGATTGRSAPPRPTGPTQLPSPVRHVASDASLMYPDGRPIVLEGRWYSAEATDEVVVSELFRDQEHVSVGDRLTVTFAAPDELGGPGDDGRFHGPQTTVRVVGVARALHDLGAQVDEVSAVSEGVGLAVGPGVAATTPGSIGYGGVLIDVADGQINVVRSAIEEAFPDRLFNLTPAVAPDELGPISEAIDYEAAGVLVFAGLAGLAAVVFAGQAVARQSRREWADVSALRALGLSGRQTAVAAGLRGVVTGIFAAGIATLTALCLSPLGPLGVARAAETDPGLRADGLVLSAGALLVIGACVLATSIPAWRLAARGRDATSGPGTRPLVLPPGPFPPSAVAGAGMAVNGAKGSHGFPLGTAFLTVALGTGALVAATCLGASLTTLGGSPVQYGAAWDVSFGAFVGGDGTEAGAAALRRADGVAAASGIRGSEVQVDGELAYALAFEPVRGVDERLEPVITAGREPVGVDEVALGAITMRQSGVDIGDTVEMQTMTSDSAPSRLTVVGVAVINDTYEGVPGQGAIVSEEWISTYAPEVSVDPYVVRLTPRTDRAAFMAGLERQFPGTVNAPIKQSAIRNVERIRLMPHFVAGLVIVLAGASLAHALVLSTRRHRRQLAVLKTLGFTRGQVMGAVGSQATVVAAIALAIGLPLGVVAGRWGWRMVADRLGVASGPVVPLMVVTAVMAGAIVFANLIAAFPAWRAARIGPAEALRVE